MLTARMWFCFVWEHLEELVRFFFFKAPENLSELSFINGTWVCQNIEIEMSSPGLNPGTVVITDKAVDYSFRPQFEQVVLGKVITRSTELDEEVASELLQYASELESFPTVIGNTMCTHDFYEGIKKRETFLFQSHLGINLNKSISVAVQVRAGWMELSAPSLTRRSWSI